MAKLKGQGMRTQRTSKKLIMTDVKVMYYYVTFDRDSGTSFL